MQFCCVVISMMLALAPCCNAQGCLCFTGTAVNIRDEPCGDVIGSSDAGPCYEDLGGSESCSLSGTVYNFREFRYSGGSGWAADEYLSEANCPEPGEPGNDVIVVCGCTNNNFEGVCSNINQVMREEWGARPPSRTLTPLATPVSTVYIHHTYGSACYTQAECEAVVRGIQDYHMDALGWSDLGYSFLIGGDGQAYEGRGWEWVGSHTCCGDCNSKAIAISLIGQYHVEDGGDVVTDNMMQDVRDLIDCAVQQGMIVGWESLNILGHTDACATNCPGSSPYTYIQTWAEYGRIPDPCYC